MYGSDAIEGYIDETPEKLSKVVGNKQVLGGFDWFHGKNPRDFQAVVGLSPKSKKIIVEKASALGLEFPNIIHPRAWVSPSVTMGKGNLFLPNAVINAEAHIQDFNLFHVGVSVSHHARIASYCFTGPHARLAESPRVEEGAYLGSGCVLVGGVTVGAWATVGANAVVNKDVKAGITVVGVPASQVGKQKN
jgi:sugar O-acyltransferase (sialic acid O-acetyltransferase NeuD family)